MAELNNSNFSTIWSLLYKLSKLIAQDLKKKSVDKYCFNLYDRSLFLLDAYVLLQHQNNNTVKHILLRCAFEIKIKASLYQDDSNVAIAEANANLKREYERYIKIIETGTSFTSQILRNLLPNHELKIEIPYADSKRKTIKKNADDADLAFDYELFYWLSSLHIHSSPLSLMLNELFETKKENKIIGALHFFATNTDLLNIAFASAMLWINQYLFEAKMSEESKKVFDSIWKELKAKSRIEEGKNVNLGEMKVSFADGTELLLKRKQRK